MTKSTIGLFLLATTFLSSPVCAGAEVPITDNTEKNVVRGYEEATQDDYDFSLSEADAEGRPSTKYYKINLKSENFSTSPNISWTEVGEDQKDEQNVIVISLPGENAKYFRYDYQNNDSSREYFTSSQKDLSGNVIGDFAGSRQSASGAAVYNGKDRSIESIVGDFIHNTVAATDRPEKGGAIYSQGTIGKISGNFVGNAVVSQKDTYANGGAVYNDKGSIGQIEGNFIGNYTMASEYNSASGGAVYNEGKIGKINGDFVANKTSTAESYVYGGAIFNLDTIDTINGNFIGNSVSTSGYYSYAYGGAVHNTSDSTIANLHGNFINNFAFSADSSAYGGAIYNAGNIGSVSGDLIANHTSASDLLALGGAVYTSSDMTFSAGGKVRTISGNYTEDTKRGKNYNGLFVYKLSSSLPMITFDTAGGGAWVINDNIEGGTDNLFSVGYKTQYNLAFKGDGVLNENGLTDQYVSINNDIVNAGEVTVEGTTLRFGAYQHEDKTAHNWDGHGRFLAALKADGTADLDAEAVTSLSLNNAAFDLYNKYQDMVNLKGWKASGDSFLHVDVDVENLTADMLNVNGNVEGTTKLVLYPTSDKDIRGESILFAQSTNDTTGNADSFKVWRVYRSPYMFETKYTKTGENANKWELEMNDTVNPDAGSEPDFPEINAIGKVEVAPEVIAYGALPAAAFEQTRSVVDNVFGQTGRTDAEHNLWINPTYYTSNIDAPFDVDADVWGIEAGGDLQHDLNNKLGLFVSYRKGNYDMNGDGKHYYSTVGSEIDIDSYLAGLYYRYDRNNWYAFATLYGGIQQADIKTDDGIKSDTDGVEFGASLEAGYDYNLTDTVYLTPSLGVFYTQVNYDDATDSVGKKAEYNDLKQIELEAGVKLTKAFRLDEGYANVYVKPSVVQTLVDGDEVNITSLGKTNTLDDETLGRIELGGRYGFTENLSAYGWANYTFGSDYDATTVGLGLNYAF